MKKLSIILHLLFSKRYLFMSFDGNGIFKTIDQYYECTGEDISDASYTLTERYLALEENIRFTNEILNPK